MKNYQLILLLSVLAVSCSVSAASDYATEMVEYSGSFGPSPYDDPHAVLGKPATMCQNIPGPWGGGSFRVKLVEAAYNVDLDGNKVLTTLGSGDYIIVKFDHKVVDYPGNLYGQDFIVFGNAFFAGNGTGIDDSADLRNFLLFSGLFPEPVTVAVSQDGAVWHEFTDGPYADDLFPTQAFDWDVDVYNQTGNGWSEKEMAFTRPVDPSLTAFDFENISVAQAIDLYDGSGGGTSFDLQDLPGYNDLVVDPNSGFRWIQYVKFTGSGGEVDAVSDVSACGDPTHPHLPGDVNRDCRVDLIDFAMMAENWLQCTYKCD